MKKKILKTFLIMLLVFPLSAKANIICNDGTRSPSCQDCHRGCCSHHGGCTNNPNTGSGTTQNNTKKKKTTTTTTKGTNATESNYENKNNIVSNESKKETQEIAENNKETNNNTTTNYNKYTIKEENQNKTISNIDLKEKNSNDDSGSIAEAIGGMAVTGAVGAIVYKIKKGKINNK